MRLLFVFLFLSEVASAQHLSTIGKGWAGNSVNTVVFRRNAITSHQDIQYASYYDSLGFLILAKRKLGTDKWEVKRTPYSGNIRDAHNSISIMVDGEGYLHVAWDHHASKLRYCKSIRPGSLELTGEMKMTGENEENVTYPEFYKLNNGDLILLYRDGSSGRGNLVMNRYQTRERKWSRVHNNLLDGEGERNAYWQACVDDKGTFHLSWVWRESSDVASNHDFSYARSSDHGVTWFTSSGKRYALPINQATAERVLKVPEGSELINSTSMTADEKGNPYIVSYWREEGQTVPQYQVVYFNGKQWLRQQVSNRTTPFTLSGVGTKRIPISRPQIVLDKQSIHVIFRDAERGSKISIATSKKSDPQRWITSDLTDFSVGQWEPNFDTELWRKKNKLHVFVQFTGQGDGEKTEVIKAQAVSVLEAEVK